MSNIEKVKAEIERRKGYISVTHFAEELLAFIDSLPEEKPSEDLEEAAEDSWALYEYRETPQGLYSSCYQDGFIAGAKWMDSKMPMPEDTVIFQKGVAEGRRLEREEREENKRKEDELPRFYGD